jgi:hypothetical protein
MDTLRVQGFAENFFNDYVAVSKLRLNSASSVSPCRKTLQNLPAKLVIAFY